MTPNTLDVAIIGAGAAGLMAGICAGRAARDGGAARSIAVLDGAAKPGAKILVSGGGRCNVTHDVVHPHDFNGSNRNQIAKVLRSFTVESTVEFFRGIGVELKREVTGKLFPITDDARTVLSALLRAMDDAGVRLLADHRVTAVRHAGDGFEIDLAGRGTLAARRLILATGGKSLPKTGSDGAGYELARALGHTVTHTTPALVPLVLPGGHWLTRLSGIALDVELALAAASGKVIHRRPGSLLFTHFGLSGPAAMDISRHWIAAHAQHPDVQLTAHLLPGFDAPAVEQRFLASAASSPRSSLATTLAAWLPARLADALVAEAGVTPATPLAQLGREQRRALVRLITALPLPVVRDRGWLFAEVTAGGVPLDEIDTATMASRRCPGLFLCGEILDADGRIGGYNFQWAWATGRLAGKNV